MVPKIEATSLKRQMAITSRGSSFSVVYRPLERSTFDGKHGMASLTYQRGLALGEFDWLYAGPTPNRLAGGAYTLDGAFRAGYLQGLVDAYNKYCN